MASFMGIAMTGLIFFQSYWIRNAITVKERQFNQLINKTLNEIAYEVQKQETVHHIIDEINPFYFDSTIGFYDTEFEIEHDFFFYQKTSGQNINASISVFSSDTFVIIDDRDNYGNKTSDVVNTSMNKYLLFPSLRKRVVERKIFVNNVLSKMFRLNPDIEDRVNPRKLENIIRYLDRHVDRFST